MRSKFFDRNANLEYLKGTYSQLKEWTFFFANSGAEIFVSKRSSDIFIVLDQIRLNFYFLCLVFDILI